MYVNAELINTTSLSLDGNTFTDAKERYTY